MKKLLAVLMVVVLMFSLGACTGNDSKDIEAAKETVEEFMAAYKELDAEKIKELVVDEDALPEEIKDLNISGMLDEMPEEVDEYKADFEQAFNKLVEKMTENISYKIEKEEKTEDNVCEFKLTVETPDVESSGFEDKLAELFTEENMMNIMGEMLESGEIDLNMDQNTMIDKMMGKILEMFNEFIDELEFETSTEEVKLVVKCEDDNWLIDAEESDLGEI